MIADGPRPRPPAAPSHQRRLLVHPAIRTYREALYRRLGEDGFEFLWTSINMNRPHERQEVEAILQRFPFPNRIARDWKFLPFRNFTPDLTSVFTYDLVIFSGLTSIPFLLCTL